MSRAPDQLAPSWLPRQQRRYVDRALRKLIRRNVCSLCGGSFRHNSPTATSFNMQGDAVVACERCIDRLAEIFAMGLYSDRQYDFLQPSGSEVRPERVAEAFAAYTKMIAATDELLADVERRGGGIRPTHVGLSNYPWTADDRDWFRQNPERAHHMRMPFPGELDEEVPAGHTLLMLLRQIEPGKRLKIGLGLNSDWLPLPDDEAVAHALFEVAAQHEAIPPDRQAFDALIKEYTALADGNAS
jgi:hypothetical protein